MTIWRLNGTPEENDLILSALSVCDFPFDWLAPSLAREGKTSVSVDWADLSRYNHSAEAHDHADGAHTITREIDGRARVLGLFYLPPHTRVVLDAALVGHPSLAREVFLAEAAHAVDYHYMKDRGLRKAVWNALHADHEDTATEPGESGDVGHGHSWFDGPGGYAAMVGETFMEAFTKAFAPAVPVTIQLAHPVSWTAAREVRMALLGTTPEPEPTPQALYFATATGNVFHDQHLNVRPGRSFEGREAAVAAGLRACRTCKP